jgi:hypothetical protein
VFDLVREPNGEVLRRLFHALAQHSSYVIMVLQDDLGLSETGLALLNRLQQHLVERERSSCWPGTLLMDKEATILRFTSSETVVQELIGSADGLYGWQQPALPEDLAFVRDDLTAILASICHEHDAYLEISDEEYESLAASVPVFVDIVRLHAED